MPATVLLVSFHLVSNGLIRGSPILATKFIETKLSLRNTRFYSVISVRYDRTDV